MEREGIGPGELAERAQLPPSTVKDAISGRTELTLRVMIHLAHGFQLRSIEELIAPFGTSELRRSEFGSDVVT